MKPPTHATPSGDRRVGRLYVQALERCGHEVHLASTFRSHEPKGDTGRQTSLRVEGLAEAQALTARWLDGPPDRRPELWFTYHLYHKAPDWLGPTVSRALGIPYVVAEPSHAPKRAGGAWSIGFDAAVAAIRQAALLLCPIRDDVACLETVADPARIAFFPPFLDATPFRDSKRRRDAARADLSRGHGLDPSAPWLAVAAMMRPGDKLASFRALAQALGRLEDLSWQVLVAGDGAARLQVADAFGSCAAGRVHLLGHLEQAQLADLFAASDLYVWPGVNEAYGMAPLEAQAAGLPAISCNTRGIPDVIMHGRTGLLAPPEDPDAFAQAVRTLLLDDARRREMGRAAAEFVSHERELGPASTALDTVLQRMLHR